MNIQPVAAASSNDATGAKRTKYRDSEGHLEMPPASATPAPSIGPHTKIEHERPEVRLARSEQSTTDAMGLDKHRSVVGGHYGPGFAKQAATYGIALGVVAVLGIGGFFLAKELDKAPAQYQDEAPWSQSDATQRTPAPIE